MRIYSIAYGAILLAITGMGTAHGAIVADSIAEFSNTQGQENWTYGIFIAGTDPSALTPYTTAGFQNFDNFDIAENDWLASSALVGAQNNTFLKLGAEGGHPTGIGPGAQNTIIWAMRRYASEVDGLYDLNIDLKKANVVNPAGGGITGRVFVNGTEVFTQFIANDDNVGVQLKLLIDLEVGSLIDFAIDPTGITPTPGGDNIYSARADGTHFAAIIETPTAVPLPGALFFLVPALGILGGVARRR
ncbi:MAG: VPLPA-CTERM sorting domain-containing protein [Proteobacteria bacterium]|nr:VPLPA-CTERM sorting domain-containing protein [Pseudomonadota bacterium]